ncbi:cytochrome P450 [Saccharopolyspora flava]|uniref:Cytochrome P450 n=1 Tax=Saccharopolyspora flava TaxID=95161 RepID=A0A1I6PPE7_9PSEU|nr:cytochrome P450 [Saccharopolyspora flava]SFS42064.1 Cytochrome P450 [Saccharopolyspora flava]
MSCPLYTPTDLAGLEFDPFLADALRHRPVSRIRMPYGDGDAWLVTRYDDVRMVTSDPRFSRAEIVGRTFPKMTPHHIPVDKAVSFADPPEHARVRRVVAKAFDQRSTEDLRKHAEQVVHELIDGMVRAGSPSDIVEHVTSPFPVRMVGEILGVPAPDWPRMTGWASTILRVAPDEDALKQVAEAKEAARRYFLDLAEQRLAEPREDLMSVLAASCHEGVLDEEELIALALLLQFNGWHAVRNNSSNMIYLLLTTPGLKDRLLADPGLVPQAVEEFLRYIPHKSGLGQPRVATEDVEVGGVLIPEGSFVYVSYLTANRDDSVFPDPDRLDIDRTEVGHLSFGHGPHYCMAPLLARMESQVLLGTLLDRLPELELAVAPDEIRMQPGALIRGPIAFPVTW